MRANTRLGLLALCLFAVSGCAAVDDQACCEPSCAGEPLGYLEARGKDLLDVFELNVGFGAGLHAAAAVTPLRVGWGISRTRRTGTMGRAVGTWSESRRECFLLLDAVRWEREICCGNDELLDPCRTPLHNRRGGDLWFKGYRWFEDENLWTTSFHDLEKHWGDTGVEATLGFVSIDAFVSPVEAFDFVFGLFGCDGVSLDDTRPAHDAH